MKITRRITLALALAIGISSVASPVVAYAQQTTPPIELTENNEAELHSLELELQEELDKAEFAARSIDLPDVGAKEHIEKLKKAIEIVKKMINGQIPGVDLRTIPARNQLLIDIAHAITYDATELVNKERGAHVIMGFSITKATLKVIDPLASLEALETAGESLKEAMVKASQKPDLTEDSVATHYSLDSLKENIKQARRLSRRELAGYISPESLRELNNAIESADKVAHKRRVTVGEVEAANAALNEAVDKALAEMDAEDFRASDADKEILKAKIREIKERRKNELKGNVDKDVLRELDEEIKSAKHVLKSSKSTIKEVREAAEDLQEAFDLALASLSPEEQDMENQMNALDAAF